MNFENSYLSKKKIKCINHLYFMRTKFSDAPSFNTKLFSTDIHGILESENRQLYRCTGTIVAELH